MTFSTPIAQEQVEALLVSTVLCPMLDNPFDGGPYETMVLKGSTDLFCERATNREDAMANHQRGIEFAYETQGFPY